MSKVLVVEDSKNISNMVKVCLEKHGYDVVTVYDGLTAVNNVFNIQPQLILLDVLIPKMNGYLVAEVLKQDAKTKQIPIIMMSAKVQEDDINKAYKIGIDEYLIKPFSPEMLLEKIKAVISKEG